MTESKPADDERRSIRSFVRRQGRFTSAQRQALESLWARYGLHSGEGIIDFEALFPGCSRRAVEIGFGMGHTLAELARRSPDTAYIGIEVHLPGVGKLLSLAEQEELRNLRVFNEDAVEVFRQALADSSLDAVLMFFPDPWHKKRHHKRRLLQRAFAELVVRKLKPGGHFHLATDWLEYAEQMLEVLSLIPGLENTAIDGGYVARPASRPLTRFEQRGLRLGHEVRDLVFRRASGF